MWQDVKKLPEQDGRYFIMVDFHHPLISNDEIVRVSIPMVGNYRVTDGWVGVYPSMTITHWMKVPALEE